MTHAEHHQRAHVAEDRVADAVGELGTVLVGEREAQAILAGLGQGTGEAVGRVVVELVHQQVEVAAFTLGLIHAAHGRELELADLVLDRRDRLAQEPRVVLGELHEAILQRLEAELPALEEELALLGHEWLTREAFSATARELLRVWRWGSFAVRRQLAELRVRVPRSGPVRVE